MTPGLTAAALSLDGRIQDAGAYAGFAAIIGLAVLSLLYFGQARELKRLREWAGRAPERTVELQQQAAVAAQQRSVAPPRPAGAPVPGGPVPAGRPRPGAPAIPGARPPLPANGAGQATQAIPALGGPAVAGAGAAAGAAVAPGEGAPGGPGQVPPGERPRTTGAPANGAPDLEKHPPAAPTPPVPATAAGAAAAVAGAGVPGVPVAPDEDTGPQGLTDDTGRERAVPLRSANAARAATVGGPRTPARSGAEVWPPEDQEREGPSAVILGIVGLVAVALVVVVLLVAGVFGSDDGGSSSPQVATTGTEATVPSGGGTSTRPTTPTRLTRAQRGDVTVAVLNGTTFSGQASQLNRRLLGLGYGDGSFGTATLGSITQVTKVYFRGAANRAAALDVARSIDVARANVTAVTADITSQAATAITSTGTTGATGTTSGGGFDVLVLIGADKATS